MNKRQFKLIKDYPDCKVFLDSIVIEQEVGYSCDDEIFFTSNEIENYPEFWQEIPDESEIHRFYVDEKITIWRRYWFEIEGLYTESEAYMKDLIKSDDMYDEAYSNEIILDTETSLGIRELFNEEGDKL